MNLYRLKCKFSEVYNNIFKMTSEQSKIRCPWLHETYKQNYWFSPDLPWISEAERDWREARPIHSLSPNLSSPLLASFTHGNPDSSDRLSSVQYLLWMFIFSDKYVSNTLYSSLEEMVCIFLSFFLYNAIFSIALTILIENQLVKAILVWTLLIIKYKGSMKVDVLIFCDFKWI